jgi:hypothetical protein
MVPVFIDCTQSISTGHQNVTPDSKIYYQKAQEIGFSAPNSCSLRVAGKRRNTVLHLQKRV